MTISNEAIKLRAEEFANEVFKQMKEDDRFKNMHYGEAMLVLDHMYAQIAHNIHNVLKKRI